MEPITRGTTPTVSIDIEGADLRGYSIVLSIGKKGFPPVTVLEPVIQYNEEDDKTVLSWKLSQVQTLLLVEGENEFQVRAIRGGDALATDSMSVSVIGVVENGVIR